MGLYFNHRTLQQENSSRDSCCSLGSVMLISHMFPLHPHCTFQCLGASCWFFVKQLFLLKSQHWTFQFMRYTNILCSGLISLTSEMLFIKITCLSNILYIEQLRSLHTSVENAYCATLHLKWEAWNPETPLNLSSWACHWYASFRAKMIAHEFYILLLVYKENLF